MREFLFFCPNHLGEGSNIVFNGLYPTHFTSVLLSINYLLINHNGDVIHGVRHILNALISQSKLVFVAAFLSLYALPLTHFVVQVIE